jgi:hypothetical protein
MITLRKAFPAVREGFTPGQIIGAFREAEILMPKDYR